MPVQGCTLPLPLPLPYLKLLDFVIRNKQLFVGRDSSVSIAIGYGLDGPVIESRWGRNFPHLSRLALGPNQPSVQWVLGLSRGKERPGREADSSLSSRAEVMKE